MTNGWPAPASQELGANWVGVTAREQVERQFNQELKHFENVASNSPVDFVPALLKSMPKFPGRRCFPELREGSRGRPAIR